VFFAAFAVALDIINITAVSAVTYVVYRYTFYTQMLEIAAAFTLLNRVFQPRDAAGG